MGDTELSAIKDDEQKKYFQEAKSWESDRQIRIARSERWAWRIALLACLFALCAIAALIVHETRPVAAPPIIAIEKSSGNIDIIRAGDDISEGYSELLEKYWVKRYVIARETYQYGSLQYDYDTTLALSADAIGREYAKQFDGESAKNKRLGSDNEELVNIISIVLPPDENQKAVIRFEKIYKRVGDPSPISRHTFVATIAYKFEATRTGREKDLIENPLGFKVIAYRIDAEIGGRDK